MFHQQTVQKTTEQRTLPSFYTPSFTSSVPFILCHRQISKLRLYQKASSFLRNWTRSWWSFWIEILIVCCFGTTGLLDQCTCINKAVYILNISLYLILLPLGNPMRSHGSAAFTKLQRYTTYKIIALDKRGMVTMCHIIINN